MLLCRLWFKIIEIVSSFFVYILWYQFIHFRRVGEIIVYSMADILLAIAIATRPCMPLMIYPKRCVGVSKLQDAYDMLVLAWQDFEENNTQSTIASLRTNRQQPKVFLIEREILASTKCISDKTKQSRKKL